MLIRHLIAACVAGLLCAATPAVASQAPAAQTVDSSTETPPRGTPSEMDDEALERLLALHHTEQEEVRLVLLPSTVTDGKGRVVQGLDAEDFLLVVVGDLALRRGLYAHPRTCKEALCG